MITCKNFGCVVALLAVVMLVGCATPKSEPVYGEVPAVSKGAADPESSTPEPAPPTVQIQQRQAETPQPVAADKPGLIVTPDDTLTGTIVTVNDPGRFAVLRFPLGRLPAEGAKLFVYRQGLKVAELKVTGPQKDDHTVADIRSGECRVGDEVRDR